MNSKRGEIIKEVLIGIAVLGAVIIVGAMAPGIFGALGKSGFINKKYRKPQFNSAVHHLKRRKLVILKENPDGSMLVKLTEKGKKQVLKYDLDKIKINPMKKWDEKWRFVMFDIPDRFRNASNALRSKLKELSFYQFQKSIWIHPYPIENEIDFICQVFEIKRFVKLGEIINLEDDYKLRSKFKLK